MPFIRRWAVKEDGLILIDSAKGTRTIRPEDVIG